MRNKSGKKVCPVNVHLDPECYGGLERWAEAENRSRRHMLEVLTRRLVALRETHAAELDRLGLFQPAVRS